VIVEPPACDLVLSKSPEEAAAFVRQLVSQVAGSGAGTLLEGVLQADCVAELMQVSRAGSCSGGGRTVYSGCTSCLFECCVALVTARQW